MLAGGLTQTSLGRWAERIYAVDPHGERQALRSRDTHKAQVTLSHVVYVERHYHTLTGAQVSIKTAGGLRANPIRYGNYQQLRHGFPWFCVSLHTCPASARLPRRQDLAVCFGRPIATCAALRCSH